MILDCPGFNDSNVHQEFPNQNIIQKVMTEAKSISILLVLSCNIFSASRGLPFIELATSIYRLFKQHDHFMITVLNRVPSGVFAKKKGFNDAIKFLELN